MKEKHYCFVFWHICEAFVEKEGQYNPNSVQTVHMNAILSSWVEKVSDTGLTLVQTCYTWTL